MDAIDRASIAAAYARLDAKPGFTLRCPCCGHTDAVPEDPDKRLYTCDVCSAKIAYGVEQPNLAILPHADRRFIVTKIVKGRGKDQREGVLLLERQYAVQYALELLSVGLPPEKWAAVASALVQGAPEVAGIPTRQPDPSPPLPVLGTRVPSAPADEPQSCQCGAPSVHRNGACAACFTRALGGA